MAAFDNGVPPIGTDITDTRLDTVSIISDPADNINMYDFNAISINSILSDSIETNDINAISINSIEKESIKIKELNAVIVEASTLAGINRLYYWK